jgi:hypothetical protein
VFQQEMAASPCSDLDKSRRFQLADHFGPGHFEIVNPPLGFVKRRASTVSRVNRVASHRRCTSSSPCRSGQRQPLAPAIDA